MSSEDIFALVRQAEARWSQFRLDPDTFASYLEQRIEGAYDDAHPGDLYLACACANGDQTAIGLFEEAYVEDMRRAVRQLNVPADAADDVVAALREELLFGRAGGAPKLSKYSGRGSLRGWLRVTVTRMALKTARGQKQLDSSDSGVLEGVAASTASPDLLYIQKKYESEFAAAFRDAMSRLSTRQRTLLRQRFADGLTGDELATLYRVHRSTIVRWLAAARDTVLSHTRAWLRQKLGVAGAELDTIMRAVRSRLDVSMTSLLGGDGE